MNHVLNVMRRSGFTIALLVCCVTRPALAQEHPSRFYVDGLAFGDVKRFSGNKGTNVLNGEGVGGRVGMGTYLHPGWRLALEIDLPASTLRSVTANLQRTATRNRDSSVSALVGFDAARGGRVHLGYLAGVSFVNVRRQVDIANLSSKVSTAAPAPGRTVTIDDVAAATVGLDVGVELAGGLSLVSGVRVHAFRLSGGTGVFSVRPGFGLRWCL